MDSWENLTGDTRSDERSLDAVRTPPVLDATATAALL